MTIVEFLRARYDEDSDWARAAGERHWEPVNDEYGPAVRDVNDDDPDARWSREVSYPVWRCDDEDDGCPEAARGWMAEAEHIARHDPARALREVEAKRRIVEECERVLTPRRTRRGWHPQDAQAIALANAALASLASPHDAHPDYDPSWSPA